MNDYIYTIQSLYPEQIGYQFGEWKRANKDIQIISILISDFIKNERKCFTAIIHYKDK